MNSLFTFLIFYSYATVALISIGGAAYYSRRNETRPTLDDDPVRAAKVRRHANRWALAGLLHLGFSFWAYDRATRACPLEPSAYERRQAERTTRLAALTGSAGLLAGVGTSLLVDLTPILSQ
jgi:hypothetical protein